MHRYGASGVLTWSALCAGVYQGQKRGAYRVAVVGSSRPDGEWSALTAWLVLGATGLHAAERKVLGLTKVGRFYCCDTLDLHGALAGYGRQNIWTLHASASINVSRYSLVTMYLV
jgi:hypothetical protein